MSKVHPPDMKRLKDFFFVFHSFLKIENDFLAINILYNFSELENDKYYSIIHNTIQFFWITKSFQTKSINMFILSLF
jgi:hypothetical protein